LGFQGVCGDRDMERGMARLGDWEAGEFCLWKAGRLLERVVDLHRGIDVGSLEYTS